MNMKFTEKHILLLLLYSPGKTDVLNEPIQGRTRIIKMMFLFKKEIKDDFFMNTNVELKKFPDFYAWNYGPFCNDIYNDIEFFINNEFIERKFADEEMEDSEKEEYKNWVEEYSLNAEEVISYVLNEERFYLTDKGIAYVSRIYSELAPNQKEILREFKKRINSNSLRAILRYVYLKYPNYTIKSKIRDSVDRG